MKGRAKQRKMAATFRASELVQLRRAVGRATRAIAKTMAAPMHIVHDFVRGFPSRAMAEDFALSAGGDPQELDKLSNDRLE